MKDFTSDSAYHKIVNIWPELLLFVIGKWNGGPVFFETRCIWATCRRTAHVHDVARHFSLLTSLSYLLRTFYLHNNVRVCACQTSAVCDSALQQRNRQSTLEWHIKTVRCRNQGRIEYTNGRIFFQSRNFSYLRTYLTTFYVCHIARHVIEMFTQHR